MWEFCYCSISVSVWFRIKSYGGMIFVDVGVENIKVRFGEG